MPRLFMRSLRYGLPTLAIVLSCATPLVAQTLTGASPPDARQGSTGDVSLAVDGFTLVGGVTIASYVTTFIDNTIGGAGEVLVTLAVPLDATPGAIRVTLDDDGAPVFADDLFTILALPAIVDAPPEVVEAGDSLVFDVQVEGLVGIASVTVGGFLLAFEDLTDAVGTGVVRITMDVPADASGSVDVAITHRDGVALASDRVTVSAAPPPVIVTVAPEAVQRGAETLVVLDGEGFASVTDASVSGTGVVLSGFAAESDTRATFRVQVSSSAVVGPRDLILTGDRDYEGALEIVAGDPEVIFLSPALGARGDAFDVTVGGLNLDTVDALSVGPGISVTDWTVTSPTRGTAHLDIGPATPTGLHAATLTVGGEDFVNNGVFEVTGGTPSVSGFDPATGTRGEQVTVTIEGRNLDTIVDADFGPRIDVGTLVASNATRAEVTIELHDDAVLGARAVALLQADGTPLEVDSAFTVEPGPIAVTRVRPDRIGQGGSVALSFEGDNLDGVSEVDCGDGVTTDALDAHLPLRLVADVTVAADAEVGFRDCLLSGTGGELELLDVIVIQEPTLPELSLRYEDDILLGSFEVGSWWRRVIEVENTGEIDEVVTIGDAEGDIDVFAIIDESGRRISQTVLEIPSHGAAQFTVEYSPRGQNQNSAAFTVMARDTDVGQIRVRGFGLPQTLGFSPSAPADLGVVLPDTEEALPRIDMVLDGGLPETVVVEAIELEVRYNNDPIMPDDFFTLELESSRSGDVFYWETPSFSGPSTARSAPIVARSLSTLIVTPPDSSPCRSPSSSERTSRVTSMTSATWGIPAPPMLATRGPRRTPASLQTRHQTPARPTRTRETPVAATRTQETSVSAT